MNWSNIIVIQISKTQDAGFYIPSAARLATTFTAWICTSKSSDFNKANIFDRPTKKCKRVHVRETVVDQKVLNIQM